MSMMKVPARKQILPQGSNPPAVPFSDMLTSPAFKLEAAEWAASNRSKKAVPKPTVVGGEVSDPMPPRKRRTLGKNLGRP